MYRVIAFIALYVVLLPLVITTHAAGAASNGLSISPAHSDVTVSGSDNAKVVVTLFNTTQADLPVSIKAVDFKSLDESGGVAFAGQDGDELTKKYGLANWITISASNLVVPKGGSSRVEATITNRNDLSPGGHYAAILVQSEGGGVAAQNPVNFKQVLASLILLRKLGGERYGLSLKEQILPTWSWGLPKSTTLRFENTGNIHVVPRGYVSISDLAGKVVAKGPINAESSKVLPESIRRYPTPIALIKQPLLPGPYTVTTAYRYDETQDFQTTKRTVWVVNPVGIGIMMGLLGLVVLLVALAIRWRPRRQKPATSRRKPAAEDRWQKRLKL